MNNPEEYSFREAIVDECGSCKIDTYPTTRNDKSKNQGTKIQISEERKDSDSRKNKAKNELDAVGNIFRF